MTDLEQNRALTTSRKNSIHQAAVNPDAHAPHTPSQGSLVAATRLGKENIQVPAVDLSATILHGKMPAIVH